MVHGSAGQDPLILTPQLPQSALLLFAPGSLLCAPGQTPSATNTWAHPPSGRLEPHPPRENCQPASEVPVTLDKNQLPAQTLTENMWALLKSP